MEGLLDVDDAAAALNLSPWTVRAYWRQGKLHAVKIGARLLFEPASIREFVARCKAQTRCPMGVRQVRDAATQEFSGEAE
jgi:hypothetical protein